MIPADDAREPAAPGDGTSAGLEDFRALAEWAAAIAAGGLDWPTKHRLVFSAFFQERVRLTGIAVEWQGRGGGPEAEVRAYAQALAARAFS